MDKGKYEEVYELLEDIRDIGPVAKAFDIHPGIVYTIFSQKTVFKVKSNFSNLKRNGPAQLEQWNRGKTILDMAKTKKVPATLMASLILKELGIPKKIAFNSPARIQNRRLRQEIMEALDKDHFFSPHAHNIQLEKGKLGEEVIFRWLKAHKIDFLTEDQLREKNMTKTPDFLLSEPIMIDGKKIFWIESKAMFGDEKEHKHYTKKQFSHYEQMSGHGLIVYWYGFLDTLESNGHIIKCHQFFKGFENEVNELLNFGVHQ
ncbi:TPD domain-containing protein [Methanomethylovorans sp.]|uniref:C15orf41 family protein n=1 Tax=Methanomethylovorans sp. TaxID=2758717 RepID=UPI00345E7D34